MSFNEYPDSVQNKLKELNEIAEKKPSCLTPPDLAKILGMKITNVHEWLDSEDCPVPKIKYRSKVQNKTYSGKKLSSVHEGRVVYKIPTPAFCKWFLGQIPQE